MDGLIALFTAALALMGSPGPATLSSAAAGAAYRLRAVPYVLGISLGTITVMVLVAAGVTGMITSIPGASPVIAGLAAAYILYLAWRIATAPRLARSIIRRRHRRSSAATPWRSSTRRLTAPWGPCSPDSR